MSGSGFDWAVIYFGAFFLVWNALAAPLLTEATVLNTFWSAVWAWILTRKVSEMRKAGR